MSSKWITQVITEGRCMSRNGSDKEYFFSLSIKFSRQQLEKTLNVKMTDEIELDMNYHGRKVDFYTLLEDGRPLYMELQLGKADETHLKQVKHIIENVDSNSHVIVWIASEHNEVFLQEIYNRIDTLNKSICFFALCINSDLIACLDIINKMTMKDIVKSLPILENVQKHYTFYAMYHREGFHYKKGGELRNNMKKEYDLTNKNDVMQKILVMLRKEIFYYPTVHRSKKINGNVISLGSGREGIVYKIGINRRNLLFLELSFSDNNQEAFEDLLAIRDKIYDKFDYLVEFNVEDRKIATYIYYQVSRGEMKLKILVRMVKKFIDYFSDYIESRQAKELRGL